MSDAPPEVKVPLTGEQMEYDLYRFFLLISLLALSGVITLAGSRAGDRFDGTFLLASGVLAIVGAAAGFLCASEMVRLVSARQAERRFTRYGITVLRTIFALGMLLFLMTLVVLAL